MMFPTKSFKIGSIPHRSSEINGYNVMDCQGGFGRAFDALVMISFQYLLDDITPINPVRSVPFVELMGMGWLAP